VRHDAAASAARENLEKFQETAKLPCGPFPMKFAFRLLISLLAGVAIVRAADVRVANAAEFRAAMAAVKPGTRVLLAGGVYEGGFHFSNARGEAGEPIVVAAADPKNPPVFTKAKTGLHFSNPAYLELHDLVFEKLSDNGINIDDGANTGAGENGTHHIFLRGLRSSDVGTNGNQDGIKLSGIWNFRVLDCTVERWGTGGGSAIDMVGCHGGIIKGCTFRHIEPAPPNCTGVQGKGGTSDIKITGNRFEHAGGRAVNIGGSTGRQFFRPPLDEAQNHAEARNVYVEGNTFVGGTTPVAFVGVDGAFVRFNTVEHPTRWAVRILQETRAADFLPCRNGVFTDNVIVFDSAHWAEGGVNIGASTAPETFTFARNWWYCSDHPERSTPKLPVAETAGVYGRDPVEAKGKAGESAYGQRE
jgi:hypothetical protein